MSFTISKDELEKALNSTNVVELEKLANNCIKAINTNENKMANLRIKLENTTGIENELIAEQIEYFENNDFSEFYKYCYKRLISRIAELE